MFSFIFLFNYLFNFNNNLLLKICKMICKKMVTIIKTIWKFIKSLDFNQNKLQNNYSIYAKIFEQNFLCKISLPFLSCFWYLTIITFNSRMCIILIRKTFLFFPDWRLNVWGNLLSFIEIMLYESLNVIFLPLSTIV